MLLWLCISVSLSFSSKAVDCSTDTIGLCSPTVEEIIDEVITETTQHEADGITITTTTETITTTTTVTNEDSGDILDGDNGYVSSSKEGDMDSDWGGQGPATMPSGNSCGQLGTDKCAMITGSGNGVSGMGTTFVNTVNVSNLNIKYGGRTNYSIKVDKQDASDSIYMHITGKDGSTNVFTGTDILSATGTASGYQTYESGFDFSGSITTVIIEIGGRDINMSIGPMFDDVSINVLYNVINTIVTESITSVEMFIALNIDTPEDIINVVEDVFESNDIVETDIGIDFQPIEIEDVNYNTVEIEIAEIEIEIQELELEIEATIEEAIETNIQETEVEPEVQIDEKPVEEVEEIEDTTVEKVETVEKKPEPKEETKPQKEEQPKKEVASSKEKAAKKIVKSMGDKKKYDSVNQIKTLIVMQVLGNTKTFFDSQKELNDRENFFSNVSIPDAVISDNNIAGYLLFGGSDGLMQEMIDSQWQK